MRTGVIIKAFRGFRTFCAFSAYAQIFDLANANTTTAANNLVTETILRKARSKSKHKIIKIYSFYLSVLVTMTEYTRFAKHNR